MSAPLAKGKLLNTFLHTGTAGKILPVATLVLLGVTAVPAPVSASRPSAASLKALVLSSSDVNRFYGSGWKLLTGIPLTQKTFALSSTSNALVGASAMKRGFRSGYIAIYSKTKNVTMYSKGKLIIRPGVTAATTGVYSFKDSTSSSLAFKAAKANSAKQIKGMKAHVQGLSGLGDDAILETTTINMGATLGSLNGMTIFWRHGSYLSVFSVEGHGNIGQSGTVGVARVLDDRIGKLG